MQTTREVKLLSVYLWRNFNWLISKYIIQQLFNYNPNVALHALDLVLPCDQPNHPGFTWPESIKEAIILDWKELVSVAWTIP